MGTAYKQTSPNSQRCVIIHHMGYANFDLKNVSFILYTNIHVDPIMNVFRIVF